MRSTGNALARVGLVWERAWRVAARLKVGRSEGECDGEGEAGLEQSLGTGHHHTGG